MTDHPDDLLHIASCRTCRDRFTADNVVNLEADRHREPERMREFLETARRLEREREGVQDVVARLLRTTPPAEWSSLAASPELQSSAAVEQLIEEIRHRAERKPGEALTLANVATSIAEALPAATYPPVVLAQLRATAWKERAHALRYLGRTDHALASIEKAEERLNAFAAAGFDRAVVELTKARILHETGRTDEAYGLMRECRRVFVEHGDAHMLLCTGIMEGISLYDDGRISDAEGVFRDSMEVARNTQDRESQARIENNLGYCATHSGDFRRANVHFSNGIAIFNDLGSHAEATRAERGAGRVLVAKGQISAGLAYLQKARRAFADSGMAEDAVLCGVEIIEVLIQRGDNVPASELANQVSEEVAAAGLGERAIAAFARLQESLTEGRADAALRVHDVHEYLKSLQQPASM